MNDPYSRTAVFIACGAALLVGLGGQTNAATIVNPNPTLISVFQQEDPTWIEHYALQNSVSWEVFLRNGVCSGNNTCLGGQSGLACTMDTDCPSSPLTFTGGTTRYLNANGVVINQQIISPTRFQSIVFDFNSQAIAIDGNGNAIVPANSNLFVPFSSEFLPMSVVPAAAEMDLCFDELELTPGACANPLQVLNVVLEEYVSPPGPTYVFPLANPSQPDNSTGTVFVGGNAHEIGTAHRRLRNQKYAYDVGVRVAGSPRKNVENTNDDFYIYQDFVVAPGPGRVTVSDQDFPDNTPPTIPASVGTCNATTCFQSQNCSTGQIPGGGNMVVIDHNTGEFSFMAHLVPGSNNSTSCGNFFPRGAVLGTVGNSGSSSGPHLHFSTLDLPNPDPSGAVKNFPMYFNNVEFPSSAGATPRRQIDVSIRSNTAVNILPPPFAGVPNAVVGPMELEPNDTPGQHNTLAVGSTVSGVAENTADLIDVTGDVAVRGDGIEDIYRFDVASAADLRVALASTSSQNLDLYVTTGDLRVMNPTRQGTSRTSANEQICLGVQPGPHYAMVTNNDLTKSSNGSYELTVEPDPQQISITINEPVEPVEVDATCTADINFELTIEDGCCVDPTALALSVQRTSPTNNVTFGSVHLDPPQVVSPAEVTVTGRVEVTGVSGCPADVLISAIAQDCAGNMISSAATGGNATTMVIDRIPPMLSSTVSESLLWPPNADMIDIEFVGSATDNCDQALPSLATSVWSDEEEIGSFAPDAKQDADALRLRAERAGMGDGRVYLMTSNTMDACGNTSSTCVATGVPHDQAEAALTSIADQMTTATAFCENNAGAAPPGFTQQGLADEMGPKP